MDIDEVNFLWENGYDLRWRGEVYIDPVEIFRSQEEKSPHLGSLGKRSRFQPGPREIIVSYNLRNPNQIEEAIKLADLFESNNITYTEFPSREEVVTYLEKCSGLYDLIKDKK